MKRVGWLKWLLGGSVAVVMTACGTSGDNPPGVSTEKQLIDSPIAGVEYYCDGKEAQKTTATGEFSCEKPPVEFKIGKLVLGTITRFTMDGKIFPQDLVGVSRDDFNDTKLIDLIRLLQSLDADGDIDEAILIPDEMAGKFDNDDINTKSLNEKADAAGVSLVSKEIAIAHLTNSMIKVKKDIGQFGLDGMHIWMTGCWYKYGANNNPEHDSHAVTVVPIEFQERKARLGEAGDYIFPYEYFDNSSFKLYAPDDSLTMDAKGLGEEYYQDMLSATKDIVSFWATEAEAKKYQGMVGDGDPQHRTCTIGATGLRPSPQF